MQRDSLDFKNMSVGKLFTKQLIPNILGMIASALFIIVDGIFVGRGVGSSAMAAVNIVAPLAMIVAAIGLMFGTGGSILAAINMSRGKERVANINITQSTVVCFIFTSIITTLILIFPQQTAKLFGADNDLIELVLEYQFWFNLSIPFTALFIALSFFTRLTNPRYTMWCMLTGTAINIILDYIFIFEFNWGLMGAAVATDIGELVGCAMLMIYLFRKSITIHFTKFKASRKSIRLTLRNTWYMLRLGFSTFLSEATIAVMAISGNYVFMHYIGTDGVAAFSIACYLFPIIFMLYNATVQSVQPIISFNYGCNQMHRANQAFRKAIFFAVGVGIVITLLSVFISGTLVSMFIPDTTNPSYQIAVSGLPLFAVDYVFFAFNIIVIGYYAAIEKVKQALVLTILRGTLPVIYFYLLPIYFSISGIWLAVGIADITVTIIIVTLALVNKMRKHGKTDNRT